MRARSGKRRARAMAKSARAGNAGLVATFLIAFAGVLAGAFSAYVSEQGAAAHAARVEASTLALREASFRTAAGKARAEIVKKVIASAPGRHALERLPAPALIAPFAKLGAKPKIIIIFDDMGIDPRAVDQVLQLPGPVTFSFLPYAKNVDKQAARAAARGDALMLHLPMEPESEADPGPHALRTGMTGVAFLRALDWNLSRFDGYVGVNNHMGSRLTADEELMQTTLAILKQRGLFFLDSLTTGDSVARAAGARVGAQVFARDVFLDADGGKESIIKQLALVEEIAIKTGYAVAIAHPRKETLEVIGPWLTSAPARGFELAPVTALVEMERARRAPPVVAEAPALRL